MNKLTRDQHGSASCSAADMGPTHHIGLASLKQFVDVAAEMSTRLDLIRVHKAVHVASRLERVGVRSGSDYLQNRSEVKQGVALSHRVPTCKLKSGGGFPDSISPKLLVLDGRC